MKPKLSFSVATNPCSLLVLEALRLRTLMETALCWPVRFTSLIENSTLWTNISHRARQNEQQQFEATKSSVQKWLQSVGFISSIYREHALYWHLYSSVCNSWVHYFNKSFFLIFTECQCNTLSPTCGWPPPSRSLVWYGTVSFTPQSSYAITPSSASYRQWNKLHLHYLSHKEHHQWLIQVPRTKANINTVPIIASYPCLNYFRWFKSALDDVQMAYTSIREETCATHHSVAVYLVSISLLYCNSLQCRAAQLPITSLKLRRSDDFTSWSILKTSTIYFPGESYRSQYLM